MLPARSDRVHRTPPAARYPQTGANAVLAGMGRLAARLAQGRAQPDQTGKWRQVPTISTSLILSPAEREALEHHVSALDRLCDDTPANSSDAEAAMLVVVTKMMMVLPTVTQNELSAEARGEAFMVALDDIPVWSVQAAIRRWYRGDCGTDERGRPYDYHWCPAPADLRRVAFARCGASRADRSACVGC